MQTSSLAVVVLAAGQGTRMKSATPKMLHKLAGISLIGHVLNTAHALNPEFVAVVVRHGRDEVAESVTAHFPNTLIVDQDEIPGTGRAVELALQALPQSFDGQVVILSGDVPLLDAETLEQLLEHHLATQCELSIVSTKLSNPRGFGRVIRDDQNNLLAIVEEKDANDEQRSIQEINAGIYVANISALTRALAEIDTNNAQAEKYLTDAVAHIRNSGNLVGAFELSDPWLAAGINDRAQLAAVAKELNARIIRHWQMEGVTVIDPTSTWIDQAVTIEADAEILPFSQLLGATTVGAAAVIGPETTLRDTEVGEGASVVRTDATLSVIGKNATVGPFAYLRPGSYLDESGKIGTFVETKNAHIGAGSKVPHLSYVGDAEIGVNSNIGAGTIFANYDGEKKHHTSVGTGTKTGAHNVFVAPVTIGDGVYTAAGTIVRKDIPSGALGMTVAAQKNILGWVEKNRPGTVVPETNSASAEDSSLERDNHHSEK
ncbi:MAG: bifunctional UDP-N-acetylglucosamine diphosphorylase/glucosamine-1-phosphate N-acetyltransferase GlmU [Microbacteriaceae bacterium]